MDRNGSVILFVTKNPSWSFNYPLPGPRCVVWKVPATVAEVDIAKLYNWWCPLRFVYFWILIFFRFQVQKVISTKAFQRYGTKLHTTPFPGCESLLFDSDEYWECAIMQTSITLDHQVSEIYSQNVSYPVELLDASATTEWVILGSIPGSHKCQSTYEFLR